MKKLVISLLAGLMVAGSLPAEAQDKTYGGVYTIEYVYDFTGEQMLNNDGSPIVTRVYHNVNSIEEYEYYSNNNFTDYIYRDGTRPMNYRIVN